MDVVIAVIGVLSGIVTIGGAGWAVIRWLRRRRMAATVNTIATAEQSGFAKEDFALASTMHQRTAFPISETYAGSEGRAAAGSVAVGDQLTVLFQDQQMSTEHLDVWLTVENRGQQTVRWFGPIVTCYPGYADLQPEPAGDPPAHLITDLYPGEQVTACYRFILRPPQATTPKYMVCRSWDRDISFWWARGA